MQSPEKQIEETGFPSSQLSLKFASDCRYIDSARLRETIDSLHKINILVIIDGFGSGADSIGFLKNAPVDAVCLDSQFLDNIEESERDRDILEYLTRMAAACVRHINIKGVENARERDILRKYPIITMQGPLFSKTLSFEEMCAEYK